MHRTRQGGSKKVNYIDKKSGFIYSSDTEQTIISFKIENKGRDEIEYQPVLEMDTLPGMVVDDDGNQINVMTLPPEASLIECANLKKTIGKRDEIVDYVVLNAAGGKKAMRLVLNTEVMFPKLKDARGIMICWISFEDDNKIETKMKQMKKPSIIKPGTLENILDSATKISADKWNKQYTGLLIAAEGTVKSVQYIEEHKVSVLVLVSSSRQKENPDGTIEVTDYEYYIISQDNLPNSYSIGDKVQFQGIIMGKDVEQDPDTKDIARQIIAFMTKHQRGR